MYIDLDLHYSDGVSEAFSSSSYSSTSSSSAASTKDPGILTLSIHHAAPGFFPPPSASSLLTPSDTPNPFALSIPLNEGASSSTYARIWTSCVESVYEAFGPEYVIVQCGVDGLAGDPCGIWNLGLGSSEDEGSLGWVIGRVIGWRKKTILTGGGELFSSSYTSDNGREEG